MTAPRSPDSSTDAPATTATPDVDFAAHVAEGLSAPQAYLSSRFIYDERGSRLFQRIMALDAYYLTRAEHEILAREAEALVARFRYAGNADEDPVPFELIELGAGDGTKTKLLLRAGLRAGADFAYRPVDISADILAVLRSSLAEELPALRVEPIAQTYLEALEGLGGRGGGLRRVVLFLGSNIGNFSLEAAREFLRGVAAALSPGDVLVVGVDLRKDPRRILAAYDDADGVTAEFNLNLLHRANRELGADFDVGRWGFYPLYNPETGEVRSYLYPHAPQRVRIPHLGIDRTFGAGECIHTEVSRKYNRRELDELLERSPLEILTDERGDFADVVWVV